MNKQIKSRKNVKIYWWKQTQEQAQQELMHFLPYYTTHDAWSSLPCDTWSPGKQTDGSVLAVTPTPRGARWVPRWHLTTQVDDLSWSAVLEPAVVLLFHNKRKDQRQGSGMRKNPTQPTKKNPTTEVPKKKKNQSNHLVCLFGKITELRYWSRKSHANNTPCNSDKRQIGWLISKEFVENLLRA